MTAWFHSLQLCICLEQVIGFTVCSCVYVLSRWLVSQSAVVYMSWLGDCCMRDRLWDRFHRSPVGSSLDWNLLLVPAFTGRKHRDGTDQWCQRCRIVCSKMAAAAAAAVMAASNVWDVDVDDCDQCSLGICLSGCQSLCHIPIPGTCVLLCRDCSLQIFAPGGRGVNWQS